MFLFVRETVCQPHFNMTPNFVYLVILIVTSSVATRTSSRTMELAELINGVQNPIFMARGYPAMIKSISEDSNADEGKLCQIEYQVTMTEAGKCMKLGHDVTGCVSANNMFPDHPECF